MSDPTVTVVIPTLAADCALLDCLAALRAQTYRNFDVIVVDNSCNHAVRKLGIASEDAKIIENTRNTGFGAAVNQGWRASAAPMIAALNDDASPSPEWLEELVRAAGADPEIGTVASQVRLEDGRLDSAGLLICVDGSSRQRGHGRNPSGFDRTEDVLIASGSAALFRREMLEDTGGFAEEFFLYCEDTDLGLRAGWRRWRTVYAAKAVVTHRYSHSAGRVSALKAYYVERNRLFVLVRNFPFRLLWKAPLASAVRYFWHVAYLFQGRGAAAGFSRADNGWLLPWFVLKAHAAAAVRLPKLLRERRQIRRGARVSTRQFSDLLDRHRISPAEVAAL